MRLNKLWGSVTFVSLCDPYDGARTNLTCLLFVFSFLMRIDKALQNLWRMISVSEKAQANNLLCGFEDFSLLNLLCTYNFEYNVLFCFCFFMRIKSMETQCLYYDFPSTRGKQIRKSDIKLVWHLTTPLPVFMNVHIHSICEYIFVFCM